MTDQYEFQDSDAPPLETIEPSLHVVEAICPDATTDVWLLMAEAERKGYPHETRERRGRNV